MKLYHQVGYRDKWNIESYENDSVGDGLILAPRYMKRQKIDSLTISVKHNSFFDPQWFLPDTPRGKLEEYPFFPAVCCDGFDTMNYVGTDANQCATACLAYQISNGFGGIIIPTRHYSGMPTDFMNMQTQQFINPFIRAIQSKKETGQQVQDKVLLQLILNEGMVQDSSYCDDLLDWITGLEEITGVYLIIEHTANSKQIKDIDLLYYYLKFIDLLVENEVDVVLGYVNTESIILSLSHPTGITMGAYENMRRFGLRPFRDATAIQMSPNPRLYCSNLLQWVDSGYLGALKRQGFLNILDDNKYLQKMLSSGYNWHSNKPEIYKHYFLVFSNQISSITGVEGSNRYHYIDSLIEQAVDNYESIRNSGIVLDSDSDGSHLPVWRTAANEFAREKGWL